MPIQVIPMSVSQFCELLGIEDPRRFVGVHVQRLKNEVALLLEPEAAMAQTTGSIPQLMKGKGGKKGGTGKRGC